MLFADLKREHDKYEVRGCEATVISVYPEKTGVSSKTGRAWSFVPMNLRDSSGEEMKLTWWNGMPEGVKDGDAITITTGKVSKRFKDGREYIELQANREGVVISGAGQVQEPQPSSGGGGGRKGKLTDLELVDRMRVHWGLLEFAEPEQRVKLVTTLAIALANGEVSVADTEDDIPF